MSIPECAKLNWFNFLANTLKWGEELGADMRMGRGATCSLVGFVLTSNIRTMSSLF